MQALVNRFSGLSLHETFVLRGQKASVATQRFYSTDKRIPNDVTRHVLQDVSNKEVSVKNRSTTLVEWSKKRPICNFAAIVAAFLAVAYSVFEWQKEQIIIDGDNPDSYQLSEINAYDELNGKVHGIRSPCFIDYREKGAPKPWDHESELHNGCEKLDRDYIKSNRRKIYTNKELEKLQLIVKDGLLYQQDSTAPLTTMPGTIFVMFKSGAIVMEDDYRFLKSKWVCHSSLTYYENPLVAGEIAIKDGKVSQLYNGSGHFCTPEHRLKYVEDQLKCMGAHFHPEYKKRYYNPPSIW